MLLRGIMKFSNSVSEGLYKPNQPWHTGGVFSQGQEKSLIWYLGM